MRIAGEFPLTATDTTASLNASTAPIIENLSSRDWRQLWKLVSVLSEAADERSAGIPESWFQSTATLSSYTAVILLERVKDQENVCRLSRTYFSNYSGDDTEISVRAVRNELIQSDKDSIDWNCIKRMSTRARALGFGRLFLFQRVFITRIPEAVARDVLENFELYNEQFVSLCEKAYATIVAQNASKVSKLAKDDDW